MNYKPESWNRWGNNHNCSFVVMTIPSQCCPDFYDLSVLQLSIGVNKMCDEEEICNTNSIFLETALIRKETVNKKDKQDRISLRVASCFMTVKICCLASSQGKSLFPWKSNKAI